MAALLVSVTLLILLETAVRSLAGREKPVSPYVLTLPGLVIVAIFQLVVGILLGITSVGSGGLVILSMLYMFRIRELMNSSSATM